MTTDSGINYQNKNMMWVLWWLGGANLIWRQESLPIPSDGSLNKNGSDWLEVISMYEMKFRYLPAISLVSSEGTQLS